MPRRRFRRRLRGRRRQYNRYQYVNIPTGSGRTSTRYAIRSIRPGGTHHFKLRGIPNVAGSSSGATLGAAGLLTQNVPNVNGYYSFGFTLSDLTNYTNFTSVFDQYKINAIKMTFLPKHNSNIAFQTASGQIVTSTMGSFVTVVDYDDVNVLSNLAQARDYESYKESPAYSKHSRYLKPKIATAAYQGTFTGYTATRGLWIDSSSATVQYYGLKTIMLAGGALADIALAYDVVTTYYMSFRNTH